MNNQNLTLVHNKHSRTRIIYRFYIPSAMTWLMISSFSFKRAAASLFLFCSLLSVSRSLVNAYTYIHQGTQMIKCMPYAWQHEDKMMYRCHETHTMKIVLQFDPETEKERKRQRRGIVVTCAVLAVAFQCSLLFSFWKHANDLNNASYYCFSF